MRVEPGYSDRLIGAAIDIGTTTLALYLCDLASGEILATESDKNPQIEFGEDVMSRIQFSITHSGGLEQLHKSIIKALKQLRDVGNTLCIVEHDRDVIDHADNILDFGPGAGVNGGEIVATGSPQAIQRRRASLTGAR